MGSNTIEEKEIKYVTQQHINKKGNAKYKHAAKIFKEVDEYNKFENSRINLKEVKEEKLKKADKNMDLIEKTINNEFRNNKIVFIDDESNTIEEKEIKYV